MSATTYQYPMERVLYNLHHKLCTIAVQRTSTRERRLAEKVLFAMFLGGFCITLIAHVAFVHRDTTTLDGRPLQSVPLTCLRSVPGFAADADVTHLSLLNDGASWAYQIGELNADTCLESAAKQTYFSYSRVHGYLLLPIELCLYHNLTVQHVFVSMADRRCFGRPLVRKIAYYVTGPDTIMLNWLLGTYNSTGFIYNPRSKSILDLSLYSQLESGANSRSWFQQILSKITVVIKTSFLFFIITTLVSFILRETQERMLEFTHQLQTRVRMGRPIVHLVLTHLVENLVFVPIMVGMIFFLIEIYRGDKVTAFMVLSIVWVCEAFSVVSLRSSEGMHFFPRIFFLEFSIFHFYLFMFPFGFAYIALASTAVCMTYSMLFFWHRYELPAVAHGHVTVDRPRMGASASPGGRGNGEQRPTPAADAVRTNVSTAQEEEEVEQQRDNIQMPPQRNWSRQSFGSMQGVGRVSTRGSSVALFHPGGDEGDDTSSYMFFMDGEVVMHGDAGRHRSPIVVPPSDSNDGGSSVTILTTGTTTTTGLEEPSIGTEGDPTPLLSDNGTDGRRHEFLGLSSFNDELATTLAEGDRGEEYFNMVENSDHSSNVPAMTELEDFNNPNR